MKTCKLLFFLFMSAFVVAACSKGGGPADEEPHVPIDNNDSTVPVVVINSPSDSQSFKSGETIKVEGRVTDNGLYRGSIRVTDDANGSLVKEQAYEIHGFQLYDFSLSYKADINAGINYTVTVQFEDHGLNKGMKAVKIKVNP